MIALGGSIGTGLFIGSGVAIHSAGPGGALLAYALIAIIVYFLMASLGEMAAFRPTTGTFCEYTQRYVDPAFGFAMGWNYWFNWAITVATEVIAAALITQYWFPGTSMFLWSGFYFAVILFLNLMAVQFYGEAEYWLSFIKVSAVILFIIVGCLSIFGIIGAGGIIGLQNFTIADAPFHDGLIGFMAVFLIAGFSFQGTELIGVAAGETDNPRRAIPTAIRQTFWRLLIFYIAAILVIGLLIPFNSPSLDGDGHTAMASPFTMVLMKAGFHYAATIMNIVILVAVLSACNASMYSATRVLWHLGNVKQAPTVFSDINHKGVPSAALFATAGIGCLFVITAFLPTEQIFFWLMQISSMAGFIAWFGIALSHYRFRRAYISQGYDLNDLPFKAKWFPWAPLICLVAITIIVLGQEFNDWLKGDLSLLNFLSTYIGLLAFGILFFIYKFKYRSKLIPLKECQL